MREDDEQEVETFMPRPWSQGFRWNKASGWSCNIGGNAQSINQLSVNPSPPGWNRSKVTNPNTPESLLAIADLTNHVESSHYVEMVRETRIKKEPKLTQACGISRPLRGR